MKVNQPSLGEKTSGFLSLKCYHRNTECSHDFIRIRMQARAAFPIPLHGIISMVGRTPCTVGRSQACKYRAHTTRYRSAIYPACKCRPQACKYRAYHALSVGYIACKCRPLSRLEIGKWKMEAGKWKMEAGKWKMEIGNAKWHGTSRPR